MVLISIQGNFGEFYIFLGKYLQNIKRLTILSLSIYILFKHLLLKMYSFTWLHTWQP